METIENKLALNVEQPRLSVHAVANQKARQWVNNEDFYSVIPSPYKPFYDNWVKLWLSWYDGYVPWVHGGQNGLISTGIATTIVNRAADSVFGGNLMFSNARIPKIRIPKENGKTIGAALDFITNKWTKDTNFRTVAKRAIRYAFAGGFSLLKLNKTGGELWLEAIRADKFWCDIDGRGNLRRVITVGSVYERATPNANGNKPRFVLVEERRYEKIGLFEKEIPVVEYKMYETTTPINVFSRSDTCVQWEALPKDVREAFKNEYGCRLNKAEALNGIENLGCFLLRGSEDVSSVPQIMLGESLTANVLAYLYEYDFYNTCFNTDMYLARGRVLVPKAMQSPQARAGAAQNAGLDEFLYTKVEMMNTDQQKPEAIQFALRSAEWKEARNMLLECIATGIGMSVSTLASYLNDSSNRTAREVSAEESATTLFVENHRRRFETTLNDVLATVLRFYGYVDDVEIRWSKAGMTNTTVLVETLTKAVQAGLISPRKAHHSFNYDDDEEQNEEDFVEAEKSKAQQQNTLFGGDMM